MNRDKVLFIEPMTMTNLSGEKSGRHYWIITMLIQEDLIVLYDDLDLEQGQVRLRQKGSAGGHNGMKSIIKMLGTDQLPNVFEFGVGTLPMGMTRYLIMFYNAFQMMKW